MIHKSLKTWLQVGALCAALTLTSTACSTIHIQNLKSINDQSTPEPSRSEWHNDGLLRAVEFSDPVNLSTRCAHGWREITVKKTLMQAIMTGMTIGMYDPWEVSYTCNR